MNAFKIKKANGYSIVDLNNLVVLEMQKDKAILNFANASWIECSLAEAKAIEREIGFAQEADIWRAECISRCEIKSPLPQSRRRYDGFLFEEGDLLYEKSHGCYMKSRAEAIFRFSKEDALTWLEELKKYPSHFIIEDYRDDKD